MKCIKAIKPLKNTEVGTINRISDVEAETKVLTGYWKYTSKSDWKATQPKVVEPVKTISDSIINGYQNETISEKQLKRKKQK